MQEAFLGCSNMTISENAGVPNLTMVTNMNRMFKDTSNFTGDLSSWDVSNVTDMGLMFFQANNFNSDISNWNTPRVTDMSKMFFSAEKFRQDLSSWNVSNVTDMSFMFNFAALFRSDLSTWDVSNVTNMEDMLTGSRFRSQDYEALLVGWSKLTLQRGVTFGASFSPKYCAAQAARNKITTTYNWTISGDTYQCSDLHVPIKVFLQGPYNTTSGTMNASLLTAGSQDTNIIPTESPYGDGAMVESTVLNTTAGDNAIVDWVEVTLRAPGNANAVVSTTSALLQRDGDVVNKDGTSALTIDGVAGGYYISINHRNHIPVVTQNRVNVKTSSTSLTDFTALATVVGGSNAMAKVATTATGTEIYALFSGDVNQNNQVQVDDYNAAIQDVGKGGYLTSDINMNGESQADDINLVLKNTG